MGGHNRGKVVNVEIFNVDTGFVGNFFQVNEGLVPKNSREVDCWGPLRAREGDRKVRLGKVRLG